MIHAILAHADYTGVTRETPLDHTLFACDEMAGFLTACSLVKPGKTIFEVEADSVKRKMKDKAFARGVQSRGSCARRSGAGHFARRPHRHLHRSYARGRPPLSASNPSDKANSAVQQMPNLTAKRRVRGNSRYNSCSHKPGSFRDAETTNLCGEGRARDRGRRRADRHSVDDQYGHGRYRIARRSSASSWRRPAPNWCASP